MPSPTAESTAARVCFRRQQTDKHNHEYQTHSNTSDDWLIIMKSLIQENMAVYSMQQEVQLLQRWHASAIITLFKAIQCH